MAAPSDDFINQAIAEAVAAFTASPLFMSHNAMGAPAGAAGPVMCVEDDLPETTAIPQHRLPHCGMVYLRHDRSDQDSAGQTDYQIEIGLRLYHRGTDRAAVWGALQTAAAAVSKVVSEEMGPSGGRFNGFANLAWDKGGTAIDTEERSGFGAMLLSGIVIDFTRPDY